MQLFGVGIKTRAGNSKGSVLVIGGGISGIQASLDIADQGFKVYLVEKTPSIGGSMARLDKTFPTNDCSICIEAPKMVEVLRHPNIELLTYHEVKEVKGSVGNFKVKLSKKPRYVVEDKCNACGKCVEVCPVSVPNEFDLGMGDRKAIYLPFPQAVPMVYTLDPLCQSAQYKDLGACVGTCTMDCVVCRTCPIAYCIRACHEEGRDAVKLWQRPKKIEIEVGSVIVATGFDVLEPTTRPEYGYGACKNVITALQYERLLAPSGPTGGEILRPSDGKHPKRVAWIQCVGSRDAKTGRTYCSRICCMYATKESVITKEHDPNIETHIFHTDLKAYGKGFEEYHRRAKELGVKYIRSRPARVIEDPETKDLLIRYENLDTGEIGEMRVNMVILSTAIIPSEGNKELAEILGIELDEYGFFKEKDPLSAPLETKVEGIHLSGTCLGPMDIPESISQASAAAAKAVAPIVEARGKEVKEAELPPETEVKPTDDPRIGIFVCECGTNIGGVVDVPRVVDHVKTYPDVIFAQEADYLCSADYQDQIKDAIKEHNLTRILVACCTPRTHEPLFRKTLREAGLNPYLLEFVNIREHDSWVHRDKPEEATQKAMELIRMGNAKARLLEPQEEYTLPVGKECLVIGGGIAGLASTLALADMGFKVKLVEREKELGGTLRKLYKLFPYDIPAEEVINPKIKAVHEHKNIEVHTGAEIKSIEGYIGNYWVTIRNNSSEKKFKVSTIIMATGMKEIDPTEYYGYGEYEEVITQLQLERMLKDGALKEPKNVVIINCVGAREENGSLCCCRVGCGASIKNAKHIKELYPNSNVYILHRDLMIFGKEEMDYYDETKGKNGIIFIHYSESRKPKVYKDSEELIVKVYDTLLDNEIEIEADFVVLTVATEGNDGVEELKKMLRVPVGEGKFFQEAHVKLRPVDFATDGIYLCGSAHSPKGVPETIRQAIAAASRASIPMGRGSVRSEGITALIDPEQCSQCGLCAKTCPYGAIKIEDEAPQVIPVLCKGCGTCAAECPRDAITMRHFTDAQIIAQIDEALAEKPEEKILALCCNWCSYAAADLAGTSRFQYPPNVRIIRVMCSGRVDREFIYRAFERGAGMVLVAGCEFPTCHYVSGNYACEKRTDRVEKRLASKGINPDRLRVTWISASEGKKFANLMSEMAEQLKQFPSRDSPG